RTQPFQERTMPISARAYLNPALVLLSFDYPDGAKAKDFFGFAIKREPGFDRTLFSHLPNRIGFAGPNTDEATLGDRDRGDDVMLGKDALHFDCLVIYRTHRMVCGLRTTGKEFRGFGLQFRAALGDSAMTRQVMMLAALFFCLTNIAALA